MPDTPRAETFTYSMDTMTKAVTVIIGLLLFGLPAWFAVVGVYFVAEGEAIGVLFAWISVFVLALVLTVVFYAPRRLTVDDQAVTVRRWGPNVVIPVAEIQSVEPVKLGFVIRTCGAGGFLGAWGWFHGKPLGAFRAYVTRRDRTVVLHRRKGLPVVLTPDDPEGFTASVGRRLFDRGLQKCTDDMRSMGER